MTNKFVKRLLELLMSPITLNGNSFKSFFEFSFFFFPLNVLIVFSQHDEATPAQMKARDKNRPKKLKGIGLRAGLPAWSLYFLTHPPSHPARHVSYVSQIFHPNGNAACHFHAASNRSVCPIRHSAPVAAQIGLPLSLSSE